MQHLQRALSRCVRWYICSLSTPSAPTMNTTNIMTRFPDVTRVYQVRLIAHIYLTLPLSRLLSLLDAHATTAMGALLSEELADSSVALPDASARTKTKKAQPSWMLRVYSQVSQAAPGPPRAIFGPRSYGILNGFYKCVFVWNGSNPASDFCS